MGSREYYVNATANLFGASLYMKPAQSPGGGQAGTPGSEAQSKEKGGGGGGGGGSGAAPPTSLPTTTDTKDEAEPGLKTIEENRGSLRKTKDREVATLTSFNEDEDAEPKVRSRNAGKRKRRGPIERQEQTNDENEKGAAKATSEKKEDFEQLEKKLREFDFYHGFIPREDLPCVLANKGDYLLRVSEIVEGEHKVRREVILSLIPVAGLQPTNDESKNCRNVIIRRHSNLYFIEAAHPFDTVKELIAYYKKNTGQCNSITFQLKNPILLQPWEFMHSDVMIGKVLGEGAFGKVCCGSLKLKDGNIVDVAVKMTKVSAFLSKAKIREMMNEARFIRNFNHKNVVRMYGVAHDEQPLYIILELVKDGSLKSYLQKNKNNTQLVEKLKFCVGTAKGIEYLHLNKCIHRDIAARNVLLHENVAKITDFGLSRSGPNYKLKTSCKLPTKWLSPEVLHTLSFSYGSDVYAYGVTVYEIFADGLEPYDGMTNAAVKSEVLNGKYLQMPQSCPDVVKRYISTHILTELARRATMTEIVTEFEKFVTNCEMGVFNQYAAKVTNLIKVTIPRRRRNNG